MEAKLQKLTASISKHKLVIMKRTLIIPAALIGILFLQGFSNVQAQVYDDLYYTPGQNNGSTTTETYTSPSNSADTYDYGDNEYRVYSDDFSSEKYYDEDGDSYVVNNYYYDDNQWDDVSYVNSINRFYTPYYGFGFYSPCYNPWMWNSGWGWNVGWNSWGGCNAGWGWNAGWGNPWGWGGGWGYPGYGWGYPGYAWGNPWGWGGGWGNPWGWNSWNNGYWNGYNNGYWNGYANGFYDGYYGGGAGNGYYYGPRSATASNTSGGRDYTPGEYGYDKQNDRGDLTVDGREKLANMDRVNSDGVQLSDQNIAQNTTREKTGDRFSTAQRDPDATGTVKVVKRFSSEERPQTSNPAVKTSDRSSNPTRYTPATKDAGQKGDVQQPSRNNQTYQWNDRSVKEQPAQQSRPTYTQPNNQGSRDGYNRSQPQQRNNGTIKSTTPSRSGGSSTPSYRNNNSSRSNSSGSWNRSSGSSSTRSSGYSSGSSSRSSSSGTRSSSSSRSTNRPR